MRRPKPSSNRYCAILLSALCGCAAATDDSGAETLAQVEPGDDSPAPVEMDAGSPTAAEPTPAVDAGPPPPPPNVVKLKDATGAEVAEISASGKGCALGTWSATMDDDGLGFTATFDALNIQLTSTSAFSSLNCALSFFPPNAAGRQFSVKTIAYQGAAKLDDGVTGAVEVRHYYQGIRANTAPGHASEEGRFEGPISVTREVGDRDARWTPCGPRPRGVNADLLIRLTNGVPRATGTMTSDAAAGSKLTVRLMTRDCPIVPTDAGTPTAPAAR